MSNSKLWLFFSILCYFSTALANEGDIVTCPTVDEIKREAFPPWLPLYKENGELASAEDVEKFKKHILNFHVAIWSTHYLESAYCFYQGNNEIFEKIVLAQKTWHPVTHPEWYWQNLDWAICRGGEARNCRFIK